MKSREGEKRGGRRRARDVSLETEKVSSATASDGGVRHVGSNLFGVYHLNFSI